MAALMFQVPDETARVLQEIQVPGVPEKKDPHITVVYLGDDIPIDVLGELLPVLHSVTSTTAPFTVSTDLVSTFPSGDNGVPVIAKIKSPALHSFQGRLCEALDAAWFEYDKKFPEYVPHMTLAYDPDPKTKFDLEIPEVQWGAHELVLWGANRGTGRLVIKFPLSLPGVVTASGSDDFLDAAVKLALYGRRETSA